MTEGGAMQSQIIRIDMHIRDERVLAWIQEQAANGEIVLTHEQIASIFLCHRNTARAIVNRLQGAGHIRIDRNHKRGGYTYKASAININD